MELHSFWFSFFSWVPSLFSLLIIIFFIYTVVTMIKLMKERNKVLKDIHEELKRNKDTGAGL
ncbi:hypothetical protein ACE1TI_03020 [Alteribacillus sp. JSM 102045]|uniref:hypothetical protein n=1 Tax=Alteribacillus sp. JSM 102045 TaxID=1562101 RepID=UPI0035BFB65F